MALSGEILKYTDLSVNCLTNPEIFDEDVITQSIISILSTIHGERVRLVQFGSVLPVQVFENMNLPGGETLINSVLDSLKSWEDRIQIVESKVKFVFHENSNSLEIVIPYIILNTGNLAVFNKTVSL